MRHMVESGHSQRLSVFVIMSFWVAVSYHRLVELCPCTEEMFTITASIIELETNSRILPVILVRGQKQKTLIKTFSLIYLIHAK